MAIKKTKLTKKESDKIVKGKTVSGEITIGPNRLMTQDMSNYVLAVNAARDANYPRRRLLYELYDRIRLDAHLQSVMEKRRIAITNQRIHWQSNKEDDKESANKVNEMVLQQPWFTNLLGYSMDADAEGHSLIELIVEKSIVIDVELINRANVMPELGLFMWNYYEVPIKSDNGVFRDNIPVPPTQGIYYREDPKYTPYLIEVGGKKNYGKLMIAAQYVIYKRNAFGNWAQFAELFGMPFRVGKYDPWSPDSRAKLEAGLDKMGSAAWGVIPNGTSIEFLQGNQTGRSDAVFKELIAASNEEISKLFLGNTLTTNQGDKGAKALGSVHKEVEEDINISDMLKMEYLLNGQFKEKLIAFGYPLSDGRFFFPETSTIPLQDRILIDKALAVDMGLPMSEEYLRNTYGVDELEEGQTPLSIPASANPFNSDNNTEEQPTGLNKKVKYENPNKKLAHAVRKPRKVSLRDQLRLTYGHQHAHIKLSADSDPVTGSAEAIWNRLAKALLNGDIKKGYVDPELYQWTRDQLVAGVTKGYGKLEDYDADSNDYKLLEMLQSNIAMFSGFKTYQQISDGMKLLLDDRGNVKSEKDFMEDILKLNKDYNINYIDAEYGATVGNAQSAKRWQDIQSQKEILPMLTFRTNGEPCPECAPFEGLTAPVDDAIWNTIMPMIHYFCNCDVDQSDDAEPTDQDKLDLPDIDPTFANNPGKTGEIFTDNHPYFNTSGPVAQMVEKFVNDQEE